MGSGSVTGDAGGLMGCGGLSMGGVPMGGGVDGDGDGGWTGDMGWVAGRGMGFSIRKSKVVATQNSTGSTPQLPDKAALALL